MFRPGWHPGSNETAEIAIEGWNAIGVRSQAQPVDARAIGERYASGDYDAIIDPWVGGVWDQDLRYGTGACRFAQINCAWWQSQNTDTPSGVEPTGEIRHLFEIEDVIRTTTDDTERMNLVQERREILADQMWVMGIVMNLPHVIVASKDLRGVWGRTDAMPYFNGAGDEDFWPRSWFFAE